MASSGLGETNYSFTGEWADGMGLVYLRARYYNNDDGRFILKDPSSLEANLYIYASANPITRTDRTGLYSGFTAFTECFAIHTLSQFPASLPIGLRTALGAMTAQEAVDKCKLAYSKDVWGSMPFGESLTSAHNLFGLYLNEPSERIRLLFFAKNTLTKELASSYSIMKLRREYMQLGGTNSPKEYKYLVGQQLVCPFDWSPWLSPTSFASVPLTCFMGSFYYQLKKVETTEGTFVGFRIDNRTDLESGTHIALRFPGGTYGGSVEELLESKQISGTDPILEVLNTKYRSRYVVSILRARDINDTGWYTSSLGTHELGGGNLVQTYAWMEKYDSCDPLSKIIFYAWRWPKLYEWTDWDYPTTQPIRLWGETH